MSETGVWRADLATAQQHLERLPWVRTAVVTRVLPDGIRVRITEREPNAVVRTGRDVSSGWTTMRCISAKCRRRIRCRRSFCAVGTKTIQAARKLRIAIASASFSSCNAIGSGQGLSERVSEVNLLDLRDVRVQLAGDDSQIEVRLGSQDQSARLVKR